MIKDFFVNNKDKLIIERGELAWKCLVLCDVVVVFFCVFWTSIHYKIIKGAYWIPLFLMPDNNGKYYFQKKLKWNTIFKNISLVIKKEDDFRFINSFSKISSMKKIRDQILKILTSKFKFEET